MNICCGLGGKPGQSHARDSQIEDDAQARIAQPFTQLAASDPATALFPVLLLALVRMGRGLRIDSILLMLLGTQWHILFNVTAGASAIPRSGLERRSARRPTPAILARCFWRPSL